MNNAYYKTTAQIFSAECSIVICSEYRGTEALYYFNESLLHCKITSILTGHTQGM